MADLLVSEIFGPTFQGEGAGVGKLCAFVRLSRCNLHCHWCDTPYTWAFDKRHALMHDSKVQYNLREESTRMTVDEVIEEVTKVMGGARMIVISGGEPMLQQEGIAELVNVMSWCNFQVETAGTRTVEPNLLRLIEWGRVHFNVSPKLSHSGNTLEERRVWPALEQLATLPCIFKFVVTLETWEEDVDEIKFLAGKLDLNPTQIYIMPEGTTLHGQIASMKHFADPIIEQGWNLSPRLHTLIWGDERGK